MSRELRGRFAIVMTYPDGDRIVLAKTRRFNGAVSERDAHVASKRAQLLKHSAPGERVVEGPDEPADGELEATVVVLLGRDEEPMPYRYSIEKGGSRDVLPGPP